MNTCPQCGREHAGAGALCEACLGAAPAAAPIVIAPSMRDLSSPATMALVILNAAIFLYMLMKGTPLLKPNTAQILHFGGNFGPLSLGAQWWRMFTAMFVHIGLMHLLINEWCLWDLGFMAERLYGPRTFLAVYILSGLTGSLVSVAYNPAIVSAGASGAIFGIAGALISTLFLGHIPAPPKALRASLISLVVFAGFNLVYGFQKGGIDNGAHVGGLIAGLVLGAILSRDFGAAPEQHKHVHRWAVPLVAVVLLGAILAVRRYEAPMVKLAHAQETLAKGDTKGAIREMNDVVRAHPRYANGWMSLAGAYLRNGQLAEVESALKNAADLDPKSDAPLSQLAILYLRSNRFQEAADVLGRMTQINPKDVDAYVNRGFALNRLDKPAAAVESFKKAVAVNPRHPVAWYNLGLSYMSLKQYDNAITAFQQVTNLIPEDPDAWIWLSNAYQQKGMAKEANAAYAKAYALRMKRLQQLQQRPRQ
jgi:membrane associated rhomboid family serine protease/Flp pilus assembly protein TadD